MATFRVHHLPEGYILAVSFNNVCACVFAHSSHTTLMQATHTHPIRHSVTQHLRESKKEKKASISSPLQSIAGVKLGEMLPVTLKEQAEGFIHDLSTVLLGSTLRDKRSLCLFFREDCFSPSQIAL